VSWTGSCPAEGLPLATLGFSPLARVPIVRLGDDGYWYTQYSPSSYSLYDYVPSYYSTDRGGISQVNTITWSGSYYVAE